MGRRDNFFLSLRMRQIMSRRDTVLVATNGIEGKQGFLLSGSIRESLRMVILAIVCVNYKDSELYIII